MQQSSPESPGEPKGRVTRRGFIVGAGAILLGGSAAFTISSLNQRPIETDAPSGAGAAERINAIVSEVISGRKQGHIVVLGDSIAFGAAATGASIPKNENSWPGILRNSLARQFGPAGTGMTLAQHLLIENPEWDNHISSDGPQPLGMGLHRAGAWKVPAGNSVRFVADAPEFWVWNLSASGTTARVRISGTDVGELRNVKSSRSDGADLTDEDRYGGAQIMTRVDARDGGGNELTLEATSGFLAIVGIEGRIPTAGTWRVTNASINGKALYSLFAGSGNDDTENELYGLGMLDSLRADLLLLALGTNDWHGGATKAEIKERLTMVIRRQRSDGVSAAGGKHPGGDAILVFNPQPSIDGSGYPTYLDTATATWGEIRAAFHEVSEEQDCLLIDVGDLWGGSARAAEDGYMADDVHITDEGAKQIAQVVEDALFS